MKNVVFPNPTLEQRKLIVDEIEEYDKKIYCRTTLLTGIDPKNNEPYPHIIFSDNEFCGSGVGNRFTNSIICKSLNEFIKFIETGEIIEDTLLEELDSML